MWSRLVLAGSLVACRWDPTLDGEPFACPADGCPADQECVADRCVPRPADAGPPAAWWSEAYGFRCRLRVHNLSSAAAPAGLPVQATFDVGVQFPLDGDQVDQLAFVDHGVGAGERLPFYWVFQAGLPDGFWFRLPREIPPFEASDDVYAYAVNPDAPSPPTDSVSVWELQDYFDSLDASWEASGDVRQVDGDVRLGPGGVLRSASYWPVGHAVDVAISGGWAEGMTIGFEADAAGEASQARWRFREGELAGAAALGFVPELAVANDDGDELIWQGELHIAADSRLEVGVDRAADRVAFWLRSERVAEQAIEVASFEAPMAIRIANAGIGSFSVNQLRVRRSMSPLPVVILGEVEARPLPATAPR